MRLYLSSRTCTISHADLLFLVRLRRWINHPSKGDGIIFLSRPRRPAVRTLHPSSPSSPSDQPHPRRRLRTAVSPPPHRSQGISTPWSRGEAGQLFQQKPRLASGLTFPKFVFCWYTNQSTASDVFLRSQGGRAVRRSYTGTYRRTTGFPTGSSCSIFKTWCATDHLPSQRAL